MTKYNLNKNILVVLCLLVSGFGSIAYGQGKEVYAKIEGRIQVK